MHRTRVAKPLNVGNDLVGCSNTTGGLHEYFVSFRLGCVTVGERG